MSEAVYLTAVYQDLGGEERKFELRLGEIKELERLCQCGIGGIWRRIIAGEFYIRDLRETIRLGMIGGGTSIPEAEAIVRFSIDGRPIDEYFDLAFQIVKACFDGVEPVKKTMPQAQSEPLATSEPSTSSVAPQG